MKNQTVLVADYGARFTQHIANLVRGLNVYCEVKPSGKLPADLSCYIGVICVGTHDKPSCGIPVFAAAEPTAFTETALRGFLYDDCAAAGDWDMELVGKQAIEDIRAQVGNGKVICALSGGVDSSVTAAMLHRAVGDALTCIFVDTGLMRKNEGDQIEEIFGKRFGGSFLRIDARARFLGKLAGVTDPEKKRKIIGEEFIRVFEEEAKKLGQVDYLAQGTIYPDIIESGASQDNKNVVKSHHNVGGLPEIMDFKAIIEPLRLLFKGEVRKLGIWLELPEYLVNRQPFPGPGLAVRCLGEITGEKLDILRDADYIFREELEKSEIAASQYFAILLDQHSVGVSGEKRTYKRTVALRAVNTVDFMSAQWVDLPADFLRRVSSRITTEVEQVGRVVYDVTSKPPGTIEWE